MRSKKLNTPRKNETTSLGRKVEAIKLYESKVLQIQQKLSYAVNPSSESIVKNAAHLLLPRHWTEIANERNLNNLCGYSLCKKSTKDPEFCNILTDQATLDLLTIIPSSHQTVVQFCSHPCRLKMKILYTSAPLEPPYLRPQTLYPHITIQESKRSSDPIRPFQSNSIEGYVPTPTLFTLLVIVFGKLVTQRTKDCIKQKSIHAQTRVFKNEKEDTHENGEENCFIEVIPIEMDLFFDHLRKIAQRLLCFFPSVDSYMFITHLEQFSKTFQCVEKVVDLIVSQNIYSWIFVLVCLWGACQCSPVLKLEVIDSGSLQDLFEKVLFPVARNTGISIRNDIVERIGEIVFY